MIARVMALVGLAGLSGAFPHFQFGGDCGPKNAIIRFNNVVMPTNVMVGEAYNVSADYTLSATLPGCTKVAITLHKCAFPDRFSWCGYEPWVAKCQDDFGDCSFNVCQRPGFPAYNPLFFECQGSGNGDVVGGTHVAKGTYFKTHRTYFVGLNAFERFVVDGTYKSKVQYMDGAGNILGCYNLVFTTKNGPDSN